VLRGTIERMRRRLVTLAAAASLALCGASLVFWIRSPSHADYMGISTGHRALMFITFPGGLRIRHLLRPDPVGPCGVGFMSSDYGVHKTAQGALYWTSKPTASWSRLGFDLMPLPSASHVPSSGWAFELWIPFWWTALMTAVLPAVALVRWYKQRKYTRVNSCSHCGYDLRATPDRCPECGAVPAATAAR
jgi:hypothetical protein